MHSKEEKLAAFGRLLDIMDDLRAKCPWDKKQTMESLRHLTIEETYELADAILEKDYDEIKGELEPAGDGFQVGVDIRVDFGRNGYPRSFPDAP